MSHAEALAHLRSGRPQAAAALLQAALDRQPADAQAWFLLGVCHHAQGALAAAAGALNRGLELDPASAETHRALITVLRDGGDVSGALAASKQALSRVPGDAGLLYAAALCLEDNGENEAALETYDAAIQLAPELDDARYNKALLLSRIGRHEEAAAFLARQHQACPESARFLLAYADALLACGRFTEALDALDRAVSGDALAMTRRGVALAALRRFDESRAAFAEARARDAPGVHRYLQRVAPGSIPEHMLSPENIYLERAWSALGQCDWSYWNGFVEEMRRVASDSKIAIEPAVVFMSRLAPLSGKERHDVARRVASVIEATYPALAPAAIARRNRLRIGVLSPDFREHLNAYLLLPLFQLLDRRKFELRAYALAQDDGSAIRQRVRLAADAFVDLQALSDRDAAQLMRNDDIDILLDVAGHTTGGRFAITAQRPARLQVNYLGFSCSLASPRVDYAIVDRYVGSDDKEWTEARVFLPHTHFLYDFRGQLAPSTVTRRDYGLPDEAFVYCAFHRAEKISPDVFDLWMRILSQVPRSVLWFRALSEQTARNLRAQAGAKGIPPERLVFAPFEPGHDPRYLARHRLGDLMLDSLHHNAMTSACDALGAGLPMLTLRGTALASRAGESLVRAAGLPELVTDDQETYVRTAVRLATDRTELQALKQRLADNRRTAPLFDTAGRVRALEAAFQEMDDRMMRGEPPASFDVRP
ncbi:MAG TPA: tetratricopeptide repeat protein [Burkholderiales bacterium]|nr:tetratricopeptide repeat protein [Burkholderiales bacterium]